MNRRNFLKMLASTAPVIAAPTYFFAPKGGWQQLSKRRIDLLKSDCYTLERTCPWYTDEEYLVGSAAMSPVYGASGGISSAMIKYLIWAETI